MSRLALPALLVIAPAILWSWLGLEIRDEPRPGPDIVRVRCWSDGAIIYDEQAADLRIGYAGGPWEWTERGSGKLVTSKADCIAD